MDRSSGMPFLEIFGSLSVSRLLLKMLLSEKDTRDFWRSVEQLGMENSPGGVSTKDLLRFREGKWVYDRQGSTCAKHDAAPPCH